MSQEQINISHMQCWLFRLAQSQWELPPEKTAAIFKQHDILGYIADCYDVLHISSYQTALRDIEKMLAKKGVNVC